MCNSLGYRRRSTTGSAQRRTTSTPALQESSAASSSTTTNTLPFWDRKCADDWHRHNHLPGCIPLLFDPLDSQENDYREIPASTLQRQERKQQPTIIPHDDEYGQEIHLTPTKKRKRGVEEAEAGEETEEDNACCPLDSLVGHTNRVIETMLKSNDQQADALKTLQAQIHQLQRQTHENELLLQEYIAERQTQQQQLSVVHCSFYNEIPWHWPA